MANLTTVGLTAGAGSSGTGSVSTLDNVIGTAGTPSSNVQTVQGIASMTALKVDPSGVTSPVSLASVPSHAVTNAGTFAVQSTLQAGSAIVGKTGIDQTTDGTTNKVAANIRHSDGTIITDATGLKISTSQLAALATTAQAMSVGFQLVGLPTDQPVPNKVQSQTNGMTSSRVNVAGSTNATNLKASAGAIGNIDVFNVAAYDVFLKLYNKASAPTVGTDTPVWTVPIKAGTGYARTFQFGKWFGTGVSYAVTKLQADSDTTAVVAGDLTGSIDWI